MALLFCLVHQSRWEMPALKSLRKKSHSRDQFFSIFFVNLSKVGLQNYVHTHSPLIYIKWVSSFNFFKVTTRWWCRFLAEIINLISYPHSLFNSYYIKHWQRKKRRGKSVSFLKSEPLWYKRESKYFCTLNTCKAQHGCKNHATATVYLPPHTKASWR